MVIGFLLTAAIAAAVSILSVHFAATWLGKLGILGVASGTVPVRQATPLKFSGALEGPQLLPAPAAFPALFVYPQGRVCAASVVVAAAILITNQSERPFQLRSPDKTVSSNNVLKAEMKAA